MMQEHPTSTAASPDTLDDGSAPPGTGCSMPPPVPQQHTPRQELQQQGHIAGSPWTAQHAWSSDCSKSLASACLPSHTLSPASQQQQAVLPELSQRTLYSQLEQQLQSMLPQQVSGLGPAACQPHPRASSSSHALQLVVADFAMSEQYSPAIPRSHSSAPSARQIEIVQQAMSQFQPIATIGSYARRTKDMQSEHLHEALCSASQIPAVEHGGPGQRLPAAPPAPILHQRQLDCVWHLQDAAKLPLAYPPRSASHQQPAHIPPASAEPADQPRRRRRVFKGLGSAEDFYRQHHGMPQQQQQATPPEASSPYQAPSASRAPSALLTRMFMDHAHKQPRPPAAQPSPNAIGLALHKLWQTTPGIQPMKPKAGLHPSSKAAAAARLHRLQSSVPPGVNPTSARTTAPDRLACETGGKELHMQVLPASLPVETYAQSAQALQQAVSREKKQQQQLGVPDSMPAQKDAASEQEFAPHQQAGPVPNLAMQQRIHTSAGDAAAAAAAAAAAKLGIGGEVSSAVDTHQLSTVCSLMKGAGADQAEDTHQEIFNNDAESSEADTVSVDLSSKGSQDDRAVGQTMSQLVDRANGDVRAQRVAHPAQMSLLAEIANKANGGVRAQGLPQQVLLGPRDSKLAEGAAEGPQIAEPASSEPDRALVPATASLEQWLRRPASVRSELLGATEAPRTIFPALSVRQVTAAEGDEPLAEDMQPRPDQPHDKLNPIPDQQQLPVNELMPAAAPVVAARQDSQLFLRRPTAKPGNHAPHPQQMEPNVRIILRQPAEVPQVAMPACRVFIKPPITGPNIELVGRQPVDLLAMMPTQQEQPFQKHMIVTSEGQQATRPPRQGSVLTPETMPSSHAQRQLPRRKQGQAANDPAPAKKHKRAHAKPSAPVHCKAAPQQATMLPLIKWSQSLQPEPAFAPGISQVDRLLYILQMSADQQHSWRFDIQQGWSRLPQMPAPLEPFWAPDLSAAWRDARSRPSGPAGHQRQQCTDMQHAQCGPHEVG